MRKLIKNCIIILGLFVVLFSSTVYADEIIYYTNLSGVQMTEAEYNKMLNILPEGKVETITQDNFDRIKNASLVSTETIYQKSVYQNNELISEELVTKEEYENSPDTTTSCGIMPLDSDDAYLETEYKRFDVSLYNGSSYILLANLSWKKVPYVRSYDVFAFRVINFSYSNYSGSQSYFVGNNQTVIDYNSSSPGYKSASNGAGFSMNLKDDSNITRFELVVSTYLTINTSNASLAHVFVSYQHATNDVTRAQSMSYNFSSGGLGEVVLFTSDAIEAKYDGMNGIHLYTQI